MPAPLPIDAISPAQARLEARVVGAPRQFRATGKRRVPRPLSVVQCGFPSPASDYIEDVLDLNRHLIVSGHEAATFILRVAGWSMFLAGIFDGDEVVVDRAIEPRIGHVVVACHAGELTIKRLARKGDRTVLAAENPHFPDITPMEGEEWTIWGVVTRVLHKL